MCQPMQATSSSGTCFRIYNGYSQLDNSTSLEVCWVLSCQQYLWHVHGVRSPTHNPEYTLKTHDAMHKGLGLTQQCHPLHRIILASRMAAKKEEGEAQTRQQPVLRLHQCHPPPHDCALCAYCSRLERFLHALHQLLKPSCVVRWGLKAAAALVTLHLEQVLASTTGICDEPSHISEDFMACA